MATNYISITIGIACFLTTCMLTGNEGNTICVADVPSSNKTYYRNANNSDSPSFDEFMKYCHDLGMQGATIKTFEEQAAIENYYNKTGYKSHFRLGGLDINQDGNWTWLDDNTRIEADGRFVNWADGQPDKRMGEKCIILFSNWFQWHDHPCGGSKGHKALCQKVRKETPQDCKSRITKTDP